MARRKYKISFRGRMWLGVEKEFNWAVREIERINERYLHVPVTPGITEMAFQWNEQVNFWRYPGKEEEYPRQPTFIYRDEEGTICGLLIYFPVDYPTNDGSQNRGCFSIAVDRFYRRQGIGTNLLRAAMQKYPIDLSKQVYSRDGAAFANAFDAPPKPPRLTPEQQQQRRVELAAARAERLRSIPRESKIAGLRKALGNPKTPKQLIPSMQARLEQLLQEQQ